MQRKTMEVYKEKVVTPTSITVGEDTEGLYYDVRTKEGIAERIRDGRTQWKLVRFFRNETNYKSAGAIRALTPEKASTVLTEAAKKSERTIVVLYSGDDVASIASRRHKQVAPNKIRAEVEKAIRQVFGEAKPIQAGTRMFSYKMDVKNDYVAPYATVDTGSNLALGRCAITIFTRVQTINPILGSVPCLNWAQFWGQVSTWFQIEVERLKVDLPPTVDGLFQRQIHTLRTEVKAEDLIQPFKDMKEATKAFAPVIDKAVNSKLQKTEMEAILSAYNNRVGLASYLIEDILAKVEVETIWGFSNAISYVRTHGNFKSEEGFNSKTAWKLERIAGEVVSLTPTINNLKKVHGNITKDLLLVPPKEIAKVEA